jgi:hypothetical protein
MAGDNLAFPWARTYSPGQLAAFIEDLWGATSGANDLVTLDAIEKVIATHRPPVKPADCPLHLVHLSALIDAANGEAPKDSATRLGLALPTIYTRRQRAITRLNAETVDQAVAMCVVNGWITREDLVLPQPVTRRSAGGWTRLYRESATRLRRRPDEPLTVGPYTSSQSAKRSAYRVRNGLMKQFKPAGSFAAEPLRVSRLWHIRIRYVGQPDHPAQKAAS